MLDCKLLITFYRCCAKRYLMLFSETGISIFYLCFVDWYSTVIEFAFEVELPLDSILSIREFFLLFSQISMLSLIFIQWTRLVNFIVFPRHHQMTPCEQLSVLLLPNFQYSFLLGWPKPYFCLNCSVPTQCSVWREHFNSQEQTGTWYQSKSLMLRFVWIFMLVGIPYLSCFVCLFWKMMCRLGVCFWTIRFHLGCNGHSIQT
jgi:hypothetical protein